MQYVPKQYIGASALNVTQIICDNYELSVMFDCNGDNNTRVTTRPDVHGSLLRLPRIVRKRI
jgi:hypothetical protein